MKNYIIIGAAMAAISLGATFAPAFAKERRGMSFEFSDFDTNGDGQITQDEVMAFHASKFAEADADGDGQLSKEEIVARLTAESDTSREQRIERMVDRMFSHLDENEDGGISLEEQQGSERAGRMFERLDRDEDGAISEEEMAKAKDRHGKRHGKHKGKHKDRESRSDG